MSNIGSLIIPDWRILGVIFILPFIAYLTAWTLSTHAAFFPRPLREAKEILIVLAHPDDECASHHPIQLTFSTVLLTLYFADTLERSSARERPCSISRYTPPHLHYNRKSTPCRAK